MMKSFEKSTVQPRKCPICRVTTLDSGWKHIFSDRCPRCDEFFTFGVKQFYELYGQNQKFTASGLHSFELSMVKSEDVDKFGISRDQLLKSDLRSMKVTSSVLVTEKSMEDLAYFIRHHKSLERFHIELSDSEHLKILLDAIEVGFIRTLILDDGGSKLSEDNTVLVKSMLQNNKSVKELVATTSRGLFIDGIDLVSVLEYNTSIQTLKLNNSKVKHGMTNFAKALRTNQTLTSLSLRPAYVTKEECRVMCEALNDSKSIVKFDTNIPSDVVPSLLNGLSENKKLIELTVYSSDFTKPDEISAFTESLKDRNCSLKKLHLNGELIPEPDTLSLALALEANTSLELVDLAGMEMSIEALKVMQRWLVKNTQLKSIIIGFAETTDFDVAEVIKNNTTLTKLCFHPPINNGDRVLEALAVNDTLTDITISCADESHPDAVKDRLFSENWTLRHCEIRWAVQSADDKAMIEKLTKRNIDYQSMMYSNTIMAIHSIVRAKELFGKLPREIWLFIFEKVRYPGLPNFKSATEKLIKRYYV